MQNTSFRFFLLFLHLLFILGCSGGGSGVAVRSEAVIGRGLVLEDSFENAEISPRWGEPLIVDAEHYAPATRESVFSNKVVRNGSFAGHYYTLAGSNEKTPWQVILREPQISNIFGGLPEEMYVEWAEYFEDGYCFPTSSQKMVRLGFDNPSIPESKKEYGVVTQTGNRNLNYQMFCGAWGNNSNCSVDFGTHSERPIPTGRWVKLGFWVKLNTPGKSDGHARLYLDDSLLISNSDVDLRGRDTRGINYLWIGGNYSMLAAGGLRCSGHRYIDDIKIYRTIEK